MSLDSHTTPVNNWLLLPHYNVKSHPLNIPVCLLYSLLCILQKEIEESGFMIVFSKKYLIWLEIEERKLSKQQLVFMSNEKHYRIF